MRRLIYIPILLLSAIAGFADAVEHYSSLAIEWLFDKAED